ncbi:MAG: hypothetical protein R6U96_15270 [Promethearchaeia archaeon]
MISLEDALFNAKKFIAKLKGLDQELSGRPLIDYLDFTPLKTEENPNNYLLYVELLSGLFNQNRNKFKIKVNKETGNVEDIEKVD